MSNIFINVDANFFNDIFLEKLFDNQTPVQIVFGGASSGKTKFLSQRAVLDILATRNYLIIRKVKDTIRKSVYNEICEVIEEFGLQDYFKIHKSELTITCITGYQILFVGLDDAEKLKSIKPKKGVITDIWVEEATETSEKDIIQLLKRLRGLSPHKKRLALSFNPIIKSHWIFKRYFKGIWSDNKRFMQRDGVAILKTTYKDNRFLTKDDRKNLEAETDKYFYQVYTLGNWGVLGNVIFKNWKIEEFEPDGFDSYVNGIDWGFANTPFVFERLHIDIDQKKIYICKEISATGLSNDESGRLVKEIIDKEYVTCDSSEPKSVDDYIKMGIYARAAKKGPGSIEYGIKWLQRFEIIIHPKCQQAINDFGSYKLKENKFGEVLPTPVDKFNDSPDACRYACEIDMENSEPVFAAV